MKNNNKGTIKGIWHQWVQSVYLLKALVGVILLIFFVLAFVFVWKQLGEEKNQHYKIPQKFSLKIEVEKLAGTVSLLERNLKSLSERLVVMEVLAQNKPLLKTPLQIITLELLRGVLEGIIPLETLKTFLQKNNAPWTASFLTHLTPVKEIKSYVELEDLLGCPPPPSCSLWQRVKRKIKSLIYIRKIDENGEYNLGQLVDVQKALRANNIQKALESFEKLPADKRTSLVAWEKLARDRFSLETSEKVLLLELSKGLNE